MPNASSSYDDRTGEEPRAVLVVDPAGPAQVHARDLLGRWQFQVLAASRLQEALELASSRRLQLVLTELVLPDADGTEAVSRLREAAGGTPVVVCTALAHRDVVLAAVRGGAADFLTKPVQAERLAQCLRYLGWEPPA